MQSTTTETDEKGETSLGFQYIALTKHKVVRNDELVVVMPGEQLPEAETWRDQTRDRYEQEGRIARVSVVARGRGRPKKGDS